MTHYDAISAWRMMKHYEKRNDLLGQACYYAFVALVVDPSTRKGPLNASHEALRTYRQVTS